MPWSFALGKAFGRSVQDDLVGVGAPGVVVLGVSGAGDGEDKSKQTVGGVTEEEGGEPGGVWGLGELCWRPQSGVGGSML